MRSGCRYYKDCFNCIFPKCKFDEEDEKKYNKVLTQKQINQRAYYNKNIEKMRERARLKNQQRNAAKRAERERLKNLVVPGAMHVELCRKDHLIYNGDLVILDGDVYRLIKKNNEDVNIRVPLRAFYRLLSTKNIEFTGENDVPGFGYVETYRIVVG